MPKNKNAGTTTGNAKNKIKAGAKIKNTTVSPTKAMSNKNNRVKNPATLITKLVAKDSKNLSGLKPRPYPSCNLFKG